MVWFPNDTPPVPEMNDFTLPYCSTLFDKFGKDPETTDVNIRTTRFVNHVVVYMTIIKNKWISKKRNASEALMYALIYQPFNSPFILRESGSGEDFLVLSAEENQYKGSFFEDE
jgi:hypothetical protein